MNLRLSWKWIAQCVVVLACVFALKLFYSTASANELRWILAPTTALVELVTGRSFAFEPYAGYMSEDRSFLIAGSCAGVNFLITAFLMLSARRLLNGRSEERGWAFIPAAAVVAYLVTLVANTTRICVAFWLRPAQGGGVSWLDPDQVHRFEGIVVYFIFLLLLFELNEKANGEQASRKLYWSLFPLGIYYATMLAIPVANGALNRTTDFLEYSLFVSLVPLIMIFCFATIRFVQQKLAWERRHPACTYPKV
jgi:exosortase K